MIALRVTLNGKLVCTAGAEDLAVLNTNVNAIGNLGTLTKKKRDELPEIHMSVGGLTARIDGEDEHLRWLEQRPLTPGDRVKIEIVNATDVDRPKETRAFDVERQEQREREQFEDAREFYHAFRHKYEPPKA